MRQKIQEIRQTIGRDIHIGARYEENLRDMSIAAIIMMVLGAVMAFINVFQKQYIIALSPLAMLFTSVISYIFVNKFKRRDISVAATTLIIILVLSYDVLLADNGFAFLWTLMIPLLISYLFSIREGIVITVYFETLFILAFYTPFRRLMADRYPEIVMSRFPMLYLFHGLFVLYIMYQYHKGILLEIEYTDRLNEEVKRQTEVSESRARRIEQLSLEAIETLAHAIDAKDPYTRGHSSRVSQYSVLIARALDWDEQKVNELRFAALLHDIGKIGVPDSILNNPRRLNEAEYNIIKTHTTMGGDILKNRMTIGMAEDVARYHHERYDGRGYPCGLKGEAIPEAARIAAVADAFDAMSSNRVYRKACDRERIRNELTEGKGKHADTNSDPWIP